MPLTPGSRLDSYEIVAPLGAGGMGEVYRARDATLRRDVAIKVLPEYWSRDPERLRRFEQEAQATAALNHPNIVSIFHVGQYDGSPLLGVVRACRFRRESVGSELIAQSADVEKSHSVDLMAPPVQLSNAAKSLYVPDQVLSAWFSVVSTRTAQS